MLPLKFKLRLFALLAVLSLLIVWATPRLHSQAQSLLFGSYNGAAKAVSVSSNGSLSVSISGGGLFPASPYVVGDLLKATSTTAFGTLADVAAGSYLRSGGVGAAPLWSTTTLPNSAVVGDLLYASATNVYANRAAVATGQVLASAGVSTAPAYTANPSVSSLTVNQPGIATTSTDGFIAANATAATAGVPVQQSPRIRLGSNVWNTTSVANNTNDWWVESVPVSGTTPSGLLKLGSSLNGAAATYPVLVESNGSMLVGFTSIPSYSHGKFGIPISSGFWSSNAAGTAQIQILGTTGSDLIEIDGGGSIGVRFTGGIVNFGTSTAAKLSLNAVLFMSATAPTIASGGCTSPAVTWNNGTAAFKLTIGSTCAGVKTITLTLPTATNQWSCHMEDQTAPATYVISSNGTTQTAVVLSNYARTTGLAIDFVAGEMLVGGCIGG